MSDLGFQHLAPGGDAQDIPPVPAALLVFVRAPEAGRVKTRLAASIGADAALRVYRRLAEHTVREALRVEGADVRVHFTPADAGAAVGAWLGDRPLLLPQAEGDLGARMREAFTRAFAAGHGRVAIIGSDLPDVRAELLGRALALLDDHEAVIGPAWDGGYYLLGLTREVEGIFEGIAWSTPGVLAATLDRLQAAGITPAMLEPLTDVDEVEDLPPGWLEAAVSFHPAK
jgi:rSAM/selenodomain-associated transferase 1